MPYLLCTEYRDFVSRWDAWVKEPQRRTPSNARTDSHFRNVRQIRRMGIEYTGRETFAGIPSERWMQSRPCQCA